jgi:UDP-N-acetylmuramoyl-tripeptide--D-alanyl-D-alanine ligase
MYIAIAGERVDGHDFVDNAVKNGATAVLVARPVEADVYQALVNDPVEAIGAVAARWRSQFDIPVIAITGSNGKTSTKELLRHIFNAQFAVHATEGNYNTSIGLPLTLFQLMQAHSISILEMGANQPGNTAQGSNIAGLVSAHFQDADRMGLHQLEQGKRETDGCIVVTLCGVHSKLGVKNMS